MSDDFGTINVNRGERAREIEVLRQHYRQHREALARMTVDAPTEHLATEYQRLINEIDRALGKLNELEGAASAPSPLPPPAHARSKTEPGLRPLVSTMRDDDASEPPAPRDLPLEEEPRSRVPLILAAMLVALVLIGWLVWRASSDRGDAPLIAENGTATSTAPDTSLEDAQTTTTVASSLTAAPASHDYGIIRKGTRATRQFEIANSSDEPLSVEVARSTCRCLYYEHSPVIPPKGKESLTVTIDGAKAKAGELSETVRITKKGDPSVVANVEVSATIQ
ncbi:MAG: DUF1573 domain-containing protein [Acidobacteriota bacterium]|nr:DUF1573 domain-containing protein [Acidobacteriota bacterium]